MRRSLVIALLYSASFALALPALAQSDVGPPLGSLYLSPLPNAYQPVMENIPLFVTQSFYLVADIDFADIGVPEQNAVNGIRAWEASVVRPPGMMVTGVHIQPPGFHEQWTPLYDFIVGYGSEMITADELPRPLLRIEFILTEITAASGIEVVVGPLVELPQTVAGQAIWQESLTINGCTNRSGDGPGRCVFPFATLGNLLLSSGVASASENWSTLKSVYRP